MSHARRAARNRLTVRRPWAVSRSRVALPSCGVPGPADEARPFELLRLPRHRGSVDAQLLGQIGQPQARPASVQYIQDSQAGLIDIDTRLGEQELVQPDLLEAASQRVQRRLDLADRLVMHGLSEVDG